ncbi:ubiquitin-conjugating enzyme E2 J2 [Sporothrix schenckii 1099-18]|uniref:Ubiquitin-conjugating enzyme E2 J2 n=1 Tax=Sporothrix schenckii 1099-18 TaxID=1397361 RepID=A0A0F2M5P7_SPOSC|nr:ubiquitin-conjugating enzyme E2 J2 [Sporothrix schenckii 1099-18]KJR84942.1 ubiquitin-conjugating enzyme E2 J2 [Sporothrix schenckii 1099-18]
MASRAAQKRLTREYKTISENPPPYITARPSDSNILEWHYIITGPEDTPYHGGQYWGTLMFPPDYPFAPPAIRMHTPSGRFQPSTRLCLSISDFHPRSFNPAWEVSTILIGLLSFMTSEEMTTGSVSATSAERKFHAARSRWWNSTGGGTYTGANTKAKVQVKAGDGGAKFRTEWPDLDKANWAWMKEQHVDMATGQITAPPKPAAAPAASSSTATSSSSSSSSAQSSAKTGPSIQGGANGASCGKQLGVPAAGAGGAGTGAAGSGTQAQAVVEAVRQGRGAGQGWLAQNKLYVFGGLVFLYVLVARLVGGDKRQ